MPGRSGASDASTASTGMFAFALWDERRETLFLARDRLGEKPLYYSFLNDGRLLFASELKSILCSPAVDRRLDPQAIEEFFAFGYIPDPALDLLRRAKAAAGAIALLVRRGDDAAGAAKPIGICASSTARAIRREEAEEELIARLRESVRHADDRRRSARRVSVGRRRFERRRRDDGGAAGRAGQHLLDLVRDERV